MRHFSSSPIHAISCLFFCAVGWLGASEQQPMGRACLRDFAEIYTLQTVGLKTEERLTRTYSLLAAKLNMSVEAVGVALEKETESRLQDSTASKLNQARALFIRKSFAQAEQLAIASGDLAHRSTPRKTDELIISLRLAAYSAMEQQKWEPAIKYLSVAVTEADSQKDLSVWAALQVGIAHAQKNLGLHDEHERTLWFIFHEYEQRLGIDSVETLHHQNELAVCLYERRKDAEAEKQIRLILASTLRVRGNDHADTQASRKNLARLLEAQGKFSEAEIMRRDVYDAHYRQLGGEALTTLKSREQLVLNLIGQKNFPEAEVESYALAKKAAEALGKDAPISLQGRAHELTASTSQKKFEPSLSLAEALVADSVRVLGADHSLTLQAKTNQGLCLNQLKRPGEALPILTEVLKTQKRTLAANDPSLLEVEHQISIAYLSQEKRKEALEHLRVALTGYEKAFGASDPRTQLVNQTANALVSTEEGKRILITERREALAKTAAKLGSSHPQALAEQFGVATFIAGLGLAQEALDEHSLVLASRRKKLGAEDLQTLDSLRSVALLEMDLQKFTDSEGHLRELLDNRQKRLKPSDISIQESRYQLGLCLGRSGKLGEALPLVESSYLAVKDLEGVNQPFLAQMKAVLDQLYTLTAPRPKNFDSLSAPAVSTVQKAPGLLSETNTTDSTAGISNGTAGPALPNAASLVPSDSIQKHIEVKP